MLEINTINDFYTKLTAAQQTAVLREMKTKERLDAYLEGLNDRKRRKGPSVPIWIDCKGCKGSEQPGKNKLTPRDNRDIHPSSIGRCIKKIWFDCSTYIDATTGEEKPWAELGEEYIPARLRRIFDFGHAWHETIQGYGCRGAFGKKKEYLPEVRIDPDNGMCPQAEVLWIKGAVDAVLTSYLVEVPGLGKVSIRVIHEYKTINSRGYGMLTKPKTDHKWQATIYSYVLDIPVVVYLYLNKDNQQHTGFPTPFSYPLWETIEEKIEKVQHYVEAGHHPPWEETSAVQKPTECRECPYLKACAPPQDAVKKPAARRR